MLVQLQVRILFHVHQSFGVVAHPPSFVADQKVGLYRTIDLVEIGAMTSEGTLLAEELSLELNVAVTGDLDVSLVVITGSPQQAESWVVHDEVTVSATYDGTLSLPALHDLIFATTDRNITLFAFYSLDQPTKSVSTTFAVTGQAIAHNVRPSISFVSSSHSPGSEIKSTTPVDLFFNLNDNVALDHYYRLNGYTSGSGDLGRSESAALSFQIQFSNWSTESEFVFALYVVDAMGNTATYGLSWYNLNVPTTPPPGGVDPY